MPTTLVLGCLSKLADIWRTGADIWRTLVNSLTKYRHVGWDTTGSAGGNYYLSLPPFGTASNLFLVLTQGNPEG